MAQPSGDRDHDEALRELRDLAEELASSFRNEHGVAAANSPDPEQGVLDRDAVQRALRAAGEPLAKEYLAHLQCADRANWPVVLLLSAVAGWNREEVLTGVQQRTQAAIKAYGLLPLPEGEAGRQECLARYLALQRYARESRRFVPQRRANEQAAVEAALANLAQTAGLADAARLEWAMESRLAGQTAAEPPRKVGEYRLSLAGMGLDAGVRASRSRQPIRSIPDAIRKTPAYRELRERSDELRAQYVRYRGSLERLLAESEPLPAAEWAEMARLPVVRGLLQGLLFQDEGGACGLYVPGKGEPRASTPAGLSPAGGTPAAPADRAVPVIGRLRLAHPLNLAEAGGLAAWQSELVRRRVVQPFAQVFRERYALPAAEREVALAATRFAGRRVASRAAAKFLQGHGWQVVAGERAEVYRPFPAARVQAVLDFEALGPFFTATEELTTGPLFFQPWPLEGPREAVSGRLPLARIAPALLSEVLRDCDRLTSVAAPGGEGECSAELLQRRRELLLALAGDLKLSGVTVREAAAEVQGRLALYSVDLSSGAVLLASGPRPLVVPERWGRSQTPLYLPFAAGDDPLTAEVLGRALTLAHDDQIADPEVLRQLEGGR